MQMRMLTNFPTFSIGQRSFERGLIEREAQVVLVQEKFEFTVFNIFTIAFDALNRF